jgi:SAM-dependent methyltransferase
MSVPADTASHQCRLCGAERAALFWQDQRRDYYRCRRCELVFVPPLQYLSPADELAEYDLHRNDPGDSRYRRFLERLYEPLQARLLPHSRGLDFGCGPGPTLSVMFTEAGHRMAQYDCFYAPDRSVLQCCYDFVTATEVVEHLHRPGEELQSLWALLRPAGYFGVMTKLVLGREAFSRWHYKNDPTHVSFFSRPTFQWLAGKWGAGIEFIGQDVIILVKPAETGL